MMMMTLHDMLSLSHPPTHTHTLRHALRSAATVWLAPTSMQSGRLSTVRLRRLRTVSISPASRISSLDSIAFSYSKLRIIFNHNTTTQRLLTAPPATNSIRTLVMAAYVIGGPLYFYPACSFFLLSSSSFFPRLISVATDWMPTILIHMAWP